MYKLLLTSRYLRRRLTPLFPLGTVTLCVAMLIIVVSIMGGFLDLVRDAGHRLMGDVSIESGYSGFPYYNEIIAEVHNLPEARNATPIVVSYGTLKLPYNIVRTVQVVGIDGPELDKVTQYRSTLFWTPQRLTDPRYEEIKQLYGPYDPVAAGDQLRAPWPAAQQQHLPAIVPGIAVSPGNFRRHDGSYRLAFPMVGEPVVLSLLPSTQRGGMVEPSTRKFVVVNEFNSGVFDVDKQRVLIPFDVAQKMMNMTAAQKVARNPDGSLALNPDGTPRIDGTEPARASEVHISAVPGVTADQLRAAVERAVQRVQQRHPDMPYLTVQTWLQRQAGFLNAVQNEKNLMTFLFGIIGLVAVFMIAVVFYALVMEKTRDIGVLRSLGASAAGIASVFLVFGLVIGGIGAGLGVGLAYLIVHYINDIHAWLGDGFGATVFIVGVPLGLAILYALIASAHAGVRAIFDRSRLGTFSTVSAYGGVATGLLTFAVTSLFHNADLAALFIPIFGSDRAAAWGAPDNRAAIQAAVTLLGAAVPAIVAAQYSLLDRVGNGKRRRSKIGLFTLLGAALGIIVVVAALAIDHDLIGRLNQALGFQIWDRSVYFFDQIPSIIDWVEVGIIVGVAVAASVLGALVPAVIAALVDPVRTLRYE